MSQNNYVAEVNKVSYVTMIGNVVLSAAKLLGGIFASSSALISDAVHSMSDCFSTVVVLIGVRIAGKKSDKDHPYGHERMECIAALALAALLVATAFLIGYEGIQSVIRIAQGEGVTKPGVSALIIALSSVLFKGWMYFYTERYAKKLRSTALHGDAVHHLSDSLSSIGAIVGIGGSMLGIAVFDPIASLVIALFIVKAAWDILRSAVDQLVDKAADEETEEKLRRTVESVEGVIRVDVLRTRQYANKIYVDTEIAVDPSLTLLQAHRIAEKVHESVEHGTDEHVKHCMVHVNPATEEDNHEAISTEVES